MSEGASNIFSITKALITFFRCGLARAGKGARHGQEKLKLLLSKLTLNKFRFVN